MYDIDGRMCYDKEGKYPYIGLSHRQRDIYAETMLANQSPLHDIGSNKATKIVKEIEPAPITDTHDLYFNGDKIIYVLDFNINTPRQYNPYYRIGCIHEDWGFGRAISAEDFEREYFLIQTAKP